MRLQHAIRLQHCRLQRLYPGPVHAASSTSLHALQRFSGKASGSQAAHLGAGTGLG